MLPGDGTRKGARLLFLRCPVDFHNGDKGRSDLSRGDERRISP